jgi:hypothetical protein
MASIPSLSLRLFAPVALAACASVGSGGSDASTGAGPACAQRVGTYQIHYVRQSGACPDLPDQVATISAQPAGVDPGCTGAIHYSIDNCSVTEDETCPADQFGQGYHAHAVGSTTWTADGSSGQGSLDWTITDSTGAVACESRYAVTSAKVQ